MAPKFLYTILLSLCFLTPSASQAKNMSNQLGVGIAVGSPTGVTAKLWRSKSKAFSGGFGWIGNAYNSSFSLYGDYLIHRNNVVKVKRGHLPLYFGIGGFVDSHFKNALGLRAPLGISFLFPDDPAEIFIELTPQLNFIPQIGLSISASFGARFYFTEIKP